MSSPRKVDRVLIKGLGLHFEGEGRPALLVALCGAGIIALVLLVAGLAGRIAVTGSITHALGLY